MARAQTIWLSDLRRCDPQTRCSGLAQGQSSLAYVRMDEENAKCKMQDIRLRK